MNTPDTPPVPLERRAPHAPPDGARLVSTAEYGGAVCSLYRFGDHEGLWGRVVAPGMSLAGLLTDLLAFDVAIGKAVDAMHCTGRTNTATRPALRDGVTDFEICSAMVRAAMEGQPDYEGALDLGTSLVSVLQEVLAKKRMRCELVHEYLPGEGATACGAPLPERDDAMTFAGIDREVTCEHCKACKKSSGTDPSTVPGASPAPECSPAQRALEPVETSGGRVEGPR